MSKEIDWSKAPEGAKGHGYVGLSDLPIWVGEDWYEHARDDGGRYFFSTGEDGVCAWQRGQVKNYVDRPSQAWTGTGLPPVGTVCECQNDAFKWLQGVIVHVGADRGKKIAIMQCENEMLWGESGEFRPIRTPEQIAAEERESHVLAMLCYDALGGTRRGLAEALYDAGYRKTEEGK